MSYEVLSEIIYLRMKTYFIKQIFFHFQALAESPEKPVISTSSDAGGEPVTQQSVEEKRLLFVASVADDDVGPVTDEQSVATTTSHETDHATLMDAATPMLLDSHEEEDGDTQK